MFGLTAFDMVHDPLVALETLVALGFERVLTSGCDSSALEGLPLIKRLTEQVSPPPFLSLLLLSYPNCSLLWGGCPGEPASTNWMAHFPRGVSGWEPLPHLLRLLLWPQVHIRALWVCSLSPTWQRPASANQGRPFGLLLVTGHRSGELAEGSGLVSDLLSLSVGQHLYLLSFASYLCCCSTWGPHMGIRAPLC